MILSIATIYFSATGSARRAAKVTPLEAIRNTCLLYTSGMKEEECVLTEDGLDAVIKLQRQIPPALNIFSPCSVPVSHRDSLEDVYKRQASSGVTFAALLALPVAEK